MTGSRQEQRRKARRQHECHLSTRSMLLYVPEVCTIHATDFSLTLAFYLLQY